jgi:sugar transferase (PEP-CTERM/EpsH1 system associated)
MRFSDSTSTQRANRSLSRALPTREQALPHCHSKGGEELTDRRISVGHTIWSLSDGGMERGLLNIINHGNQREFRHVILCLGEAGPLADHVRASNCVVIELKKRHGNDWTVPFTISALAKRLRLDILHARGWPTLVETALGGYLARVRRTVYGFHGKTVEELDGKSLRRRLAERIFLRGYSEVVTLTESMKADLANECHLGSTRVRVIPNGVDPEVFRPADHPHESRAKLGLPVNGIVIGNVARLDPVKNHSSILRALSRLRSLGVEIYLLLVGEGSERARLEREIRGSGLSTSVRLFGRSDNVSELLHCMDIYVQSSLYEGFSNTVLEAMACGLPILATRTGGTVDLLHDGEEGYLFEPNDDRALASLILELRAIDRRKAMGANGRKRVIENFPTSKMVTRYEQMYRDLVSFQPIEPRVNLARAQRRSA